MASLPEFRTTIRLADHPQSVFDDLEFLGLLSISRSLEKEVKLQIIDSVAGFDQQKVDALMDIFYDEYLAFARFDRKDDCLDRHVLQALFHQRAQEWLEIERNPSHMPSSLAIGLV